MNKQDIKQVILVRKDLNMSAGKVAAQVGHAAILFMVDIIHKSRDTEEYSEHSLRELLWMFDNGPINNERYGHIAYGGMKKIVLGVDNLNALHYLHEYANVLGIKAFEVYDESLDAVTCCAIGPDYSDDIDKVTGDLELYGNPKDGETNHAYSRDGLNSYSSDVAHANSCGEIGLTLKPWWCRSGRNNK